DLAGAARIISEHITNIISVLVRRAPPPRVRLHDRVRTGPGDRDSVSGRVDDHAIAGEDAARGIAFDEEAAIQIQQGTRLMSVLHRVEEIDVDVAAAPAVHRGVSLPVDASGSNETGASELALQLRDRAGLRDAAHHDH